MAASRRECRAASCSWTLRRLMIGWIERWLMLCLAFHQWPCGGCGWCWQALELGSSTMPYLSPWFDVLASAAQAGGARCRPCCMSWRHNPWQLGCVSYRRAGIVDGIRLHDGSLAPPCHQHADDTSVHTRTVQGAAAAMQFAAATNARPAVPA
jgi:hypothetical protein